MSERIEVVYENGVLRPLGAIAAPLHEHQHLTVTIEGTEEAADWLAGADPAISLEAVRQALAKIPGSISQRVHEEREER